MLSDLIHVIHTNYWNVVNAVFPTGSLNVVAEVPNTLSIELEGLVRGIGS